MKHLITLLLTLVLASFAHAAEAFVVAGQPFTVFVAKVDGTPPFTYQWRKDGVDISGATGSEYTVMVSTANDAGAYSVRIANKAGETVSDNALANIIVRASNAVTAFKTPDSTPATPTK